MKSTMRSLLFPIAASAILVIAGGCANNSSTLSNGTGSVVATAAMGGISTTSEGTVALVRPKTPTYLARIATELNPLKTAWAVPSCSWSSLISACSSNSETLSFNGCSSPEDPAIKISGSESLAWTGANCCTSTPLMASSACSFTRRTVDGSGAISPLIRSVGSNSLTLSTEDTSGYEQSKSGGFTVLCQGAGGDNTCNGQRQITIQGAHYVGQVESGQWDHTVSTDQPLIEQGHDSSRKILSGVVRVQHNVLHMTSVSTVTSTLTFSSNCCYPTGGSITTKYAGGDLDGRTETLTYGPECGKALLASKDEPKVGLTLHHCL